MMIFPLKKGISCLAGVRVRHRSPITTWFVCSRETIQQYIYTILHFHHNIRWNSTNYCLYLVLSRWHNRTTTPSVFRDTLNEILSFSSLSLFTLSTVYTAVTPQRLSIQPVYEINYRYTEMFEPILPFIFPPPRYSYFIISPGNILGVTTFDVFIQRPQKIYEDQESC